MTTDNPQNESTMENIPGQAESSMENIPGQATSSMDKPEMCCDGEQTAEHHRQNSPDGKCCIDN